MPKRPPAENAEPPTHLEKLGEFFLALLIMAVAIGGFITIMVVGFMCHPLLFSIDKDEVKCPIVGTNRWK